MSNRILRMFSLVWSNYLLLMCMFARPRSKIIFHDSLFWDEFWYFSRKTLWALLCYHPCWESILDERVYHYCTISFNHKSTMGDLVELDMICYFILGMDWLHACYSSIYCRTQEVKFQFPTEPRVEYQLGSA